ncbi:MAG: hypothetical protein FJ137_18565 [Deltaproteobacteria bacterium]|nr:hypothetical protein [Deltaproteobacteria bacterium]
MQTRVAPLSATIAAVIAPLVDDTLRWSLTTWLDSARLVQLPLVAGLFVESALRARLHLRFKLLLLGSFGLPRAGLVPGATRAPAYIVVALDRVGVFGA